MPGTSALIGAGIQLGWEMADADLDQCRLTRREETGPRLRTEVSVISDLELQRDVLDELEFEPSVKAAHIGVTANKGVVTLTGFVTSYAEKLAAERAARRVKGGQGDCRGN